MEERTRVFFPLAAASTYTQMNLLLASYQSRKSLSPRSQVIIKLGPENEEMAPNMVEMLRGGDCFVL